MSTRSLSSLTATVIPLRPFFFFFNDTATTEIYTLSLHDALPISRRPRLPPAACRSRRGAPAPRSPLPRWPMRSEEHTSELQSQSNLVCRLLLEKKKKEQKSRVHNRSALDRSHSRRRRPSDVILPR